MSNDLFLRRKWTFRAAGKQVVFIKKPNESTQHVLMKAFIWALYLPIYPELQVEIRIGDRYKPDVVQLDLDHRPIFWGEAGNVSRDKIQSLARRFRHTHYAIAKWDTTLTPHADLIRAAIGTLKRSAPFDLLRIPADAAERFIDKRGHIHLTFADVERIRI